MTAATQKLTGEIEQVPPAHSAIWVDGQRAYRRIRAGEDFEMPSRKVQIDHLEITRYDFPEIDLDIICGSGTYIRSLGIDLAVCCQVHRRHVIFIEDWSWPFFTEQLSIH